MFPKTCRSFLKNNRNYIGLINDHSLLPTKDRNLKFNFQFAYLNEKKMFMNFPYINSIAKSKIQTYPVR